MASILDKNFDMRKALVVLKRIKIISCETCPKAFTKRKDYKLHKLKHDLQNLQNQRKEFNKSYYVKNNVEGYEKKIKCEECNMKFVDKNTLEAHLALHRPFPHVCNCGVGFYMKEDLKCHKKIVHEDASSEEVPKKYKHMIILGTKKKKDSLNGCEMEM